MIIQRILTGFLIFLAIGVSAEEPQDGAKAILELVQQRNYTELFQTRYTEWHKVETEGIAPEEAVKKLAVRFDKNHALMVSLYEQLSRAEFIINRNAYAQPGETGETAKADVILKGNTVPFILFKMKNGLWGFHL